RGLVRPVRPLAPAQAVRHGAFSGRVGGAAAGGGEEVGAGLRAAQLVAPPPALLQLDVLEARPAALAGGDGARLPHLRAVRALVPRRTSTQGAAREAGRRSAQGGR